MLHQVEALFKEHQFSLIDTKILLAISGGKDSMVMLDFFLRHKTHFGIQEISVAHINHNLRGKESEEDLNFVRKYCNQHGVPNYLHTLDIQCNEASLENWCREQRYNFLHSIVRYQCLDYCFTAHHLNDQVETILMRLDRGCGFSGLEGILFQRNSFYIRPFLTINQGIITTYQKEFNVPYREDSSNQSTLFLRNQYRHTFIRRLKKENMDLGEKIAAITSLVRHLHPRITGYALELYEPTIVYSTEHELELDLKMLSKLLQEDYAEEIFFLFLNKKWQELQLKQLNHSLFQEIVHSLKKGATFTINLKRNTFLNISEQFRIFEQKAVEKINFQKELNVEGATSVKVDDNSYLLSIRRVSAKEDLQGDCWHIFIDYDKINGPMVVRNRRDGDIFLPKGFHGSYRKLKKYFQENKWTPTQRNHNPLIATSNEIIWIVGNKVSEKYRATHNSKNILEMRATCQKII